MEGPARILTDQIRGDSLPRAVQSGRYRRLADLQRPRRLAVGQPDHVDRDERVAEIVG